MLTRVGEQLRREAIAALPALPRALFSLHNFYDVGVERMAEALSTDSDTIAACLAETRAMIHGYRPYAPATRLDPAGTGVPIARLERRLRRAYRDSLTASFTLSGYGGAIEWPEADADIATDEDAAAAFIITLLGLSFRSAVTGARRSHVAIVDLWRVAWPWQRRRRARLLSVTDVVRCSGWRAFDEWLADRIAPELHYPHGYPDYRRLRRPLRGEAGAPSDDEGPAEMQTTARFDQLDSLTRDAAILFHRYGRGSDEIAQRLGIGRGSVKRRVRRANYAMIGRPYPSLVSRIASDLRYRRDRLRRLCRDISEVLRG